MLYTDRSIRFTASEIAAYRQMGVNFAQIKTYRQFTQALRNAKRRQRKENQDMAKRYGRRALNGTTRYFDTYEELYSDWQQENLGIRAVLFGILVLIAGGVLAYMLMQRFHITLRILRFVGIIDGAWIGCVLGGGLATIIWKILKSALFLAVIAAIGLFIFWII